MKTLSTMWLAAALVATWMAGAAHAGTFNEHGGVAIRGHDPVAYFTEAKPVAGRAEFTHVHRGSTFRFASAANRDAFAATPDKYAPQYGGYCAYGVAGGYKADIDPSAWAVVDGKLYLNYNAKVQADWRKDVPGYVRKADARWPEVATSSKVIR